MYITDSSFFYLEYASQIFQSIEIVSQYFNRMQLLFHLRSSPFHFCETCKSLIEWGLEKNSLR